MRCLSSLNFFDTKNVITRDGQYINLYFNFYDAHIHRRCLLSLLLIRCNTFLKELFFYKYRHCCGTRIHCKWYVSYQLLRDIIYLHLEHQFIMNEILNQIKFIINITQNCHHFIAVIASTISLFGHSTASV